MHTTTPIRCAFFAKGGHCVDRFIVYDDPICTFVIGVKKKDKGAVGKRRCCCRSLFKDFEGLNTRQIVLVFVLLDASIPFFPQFFQLVQELFGSLFPQRSDHLWVL
jgi:hypothetical protein